MNFSTDNVLSYVFIFLFGGGAVFTYKMILNVVKDDTDRIRVFFWVGEKRWWDGYKALLEILNNSLNVFFGEKLISTKSWLSTMRLAWVYPYLFLFLFTETIVKDFSLMQYLMLVWAALSSIFLSIKTHKVIAKLRSQIQLPTPVKIVLIDALFMPFVGFLSIVVFSLINAFIAGVLISPQTATLVLCVTALFMGAGLLWSLMWLVIMIAMFAGIATGNDLASFFQGLAIIAEDSSLSVSDEAGAIGGVILGAVFAFALMVLPFINGLFDWMSWVVSRYLIRRLVGDAEKHARRALLIHIALDIFAAVCFLVMISVSFGYIFVGLGIYPDWNQLSSGQPWQGDALPTTLMVCSTLVPTFIHLVMAILAVASQELPGRKFALKMLERSSPSTVETHLAVGWIFAMVMLATSTVYAFVYFLIWLVEYQFHTSLLSMIFLMSGQLFGG